MNRFIHKLFLVLICSFTCISAANAGGFTRADFDQFISARAGDGEPVYWYSIGTIRSYPDGELLFKMEGFDAATRHSPDQNQPLAQQYNRKIYFYRDKDSGDILQTWKGEKVDPIAYPYQFISYKLVGDKIQTYLEQGKEPNVTRMGPSEQISSLRIGDTLTVTAPVYIDFPIPNSERRIDAFENYDFFLHPEGKAGEPHQLSWVRYGDLPRWAAGESASGKAIYHMLTWRVEDWNDIPENLRQHVEQEYPLWTKPPASLEEVRELQKPADADDEAKGF